MQAMARLVTLDLSSSKDMRLGLVENCIWPLSVCTWLTAALHGATIQLWRKSRSYLYLATSSGNGTCLSSSVLNQQASD